MKKISFIGLGNMGFEMAINLSKAGYEVMAFDIVQDKYEELEKNNIKCELEIHKLFNEPEAVITMLPDGNVVKKVWEEIFPLILNKPIVIDCSTIDIKNALNFHSLAKKKGVEALDAPVSGGVVGAKNGSLTFMVGGEETTYDKVKSLFQVMGNKNILCGPATAGQAVKICNNMLLAITMVGVSEAFNLAENLKLDQQKLFDVISTSSGSCWAVNNYCPVKGIGPNSPADNDFLPGFASNLMHKDLSLAIEAANSTNTDVNFAKQTKALFSEIIESGNGGRDFSFLKEYLK